MSTSAKKRIWGWFMFDWASQPYNTLLLTFIFGPYFAEIVTARFVADGTAPEMASAQAQSIWGWGLTISGLLIAFSAPVLGAVADSTGRRLPFIWVFSFLYLIGAAGTWIADPAGFSIALVLALFIVGLIGMEFATIFTNAMLPDLGTREEIGRISGSGWAIGYCGGLVALIFALVFLAENGEGRTLIGAAPLGGLDPEAREGTRFVGVFSAIWFAAFMIPFFLWVRDAKDRPAWREGVVGQSLSDLVGTIKRLPKSPSLAAYLGSSMLYRDALNGMYTFGGVYAVGVLGWSVVDVGVFGILAVIAGAVAAFIGGRADSAKGPKPVILVSIIALIIAAVTIVQITPTSIYGIPVADEGIIAGRTASDIAFYLAGSLVGAAGGTIQSASRTMMVRQANPARMTEAFGLYALAGKATAFLAPALIALVTTISGSQRIGVTPVIGLFLLGLVLLLWVKPDGEDQSVWDSDT
ncbi:UMF1 family MFS transporter [Litoreibacter ponti]|uniref:UMF1 family MFS transporter n=1 Tax=Litoreibacter ponti TaxID=1510457 RepID=A0A2T6BPV1_9RHOB|nr:MFS transporter [Litoreibacter ponti]PTX58064.1 UMF1 family MFS transporter [Litoreibacter ponti]